MESYVLDFDSVRGVGRVIFDPLATHCITWNHTEWSTETGELPVSDSGELRPRLDVVVTA